LCVFTHCPSKHDPYLWPYLHYYSSGLCVSLYLIFLPISFSISLHCLSSTFLSFSLQPHQLSFCKAITNFASLLLTLLPFLSLFFVLFPFLFYFYYFLLFFYISFFFFFNLFLVLDFASVPSAFSPMIGVCFRSRNMPSESS
jgi:hypothetical protein